MQIQPSLNPAGNKAISVIFEREKCKTINRDLSTMEETHNFLTYELPEEFTIIVTNPPYSIKYEFLSKCLKIGKPFALLLPLDMIATKKWIRITDGHFFYLIVLNPVPKFIYDGKEVSIGPTVWILGNIGMVETILENYHLVHEPEVEEE